MTAPHRPHLRDLTEHYSTPVPGRARPPLPESRPEPRPETRTEAHPRRSTVPMRRIEVSGLLPDGGLFDRSLVVPQAPLFERAVSGFARGTLLATPQGPVAIEDLLPGDVVNSSHGPQPVLWIGAATMVPGQSAQGSLLRGLLRVTAESFGMSRPASDLVLGPGAALLHNPPQLRAANGQGHVLTPLADFADGTSVFQVMPPSPVRVYHIRLPRHAAVDAGGLEIESYHPGSGTVERMAEAVQGLFLSLFPDVRHPREFGPMGFPRVEREMLDGLHGG